MGGEGEPCVEVGDAGLEAEGEYMHRAEEAVTAVRGLLWLPSGEQTEEGEEAGRGRWGWFLGRPRPVTGGTERVVSTARVGRAWCAAGGSVKRVDGEGGGG